MSGLVESVKRGYSIEAMSDFGAASKISQTKKSRCGCRTGSRGDRTGFSSLSDITFGISHTATSFGISHTESMRFGISHTARLRTTLSGGFGISHTTIRDFTHHDSGLHTPIMANRGGYIFQINSLQRLRKLETHVKHKLKHIGSPLRFEPKIKGNSFPLTLY